MHAERVGSRRFATTHWSVILAAGAGRSPERDAALATLCRVYWPPVYSYICCRGHDPDSARDLTQGFFTRLLDRGSLGHASPGRGRFRSFLLTAVQFYLADERDRARALKRGGGRRPIRQGRDASGPSGHGESVDPETPRSVFERGWAMALLRQAMLRLENEMERAGHGARFRRFRPLLTGGIDVPYRHLARELRMTGPAVKVAIHRMRQRFGAIVRDEVARTVNESSKIDDELRFLIRCVSR